MITKVAVWGPYGPGDENIEFPAPMPAAPSGPIAWHYTSAAGLEGIIRSGELWASSLQVMNDESESKYGADLVWMAWAAMDKADVPVPLVDVLDDLLKSDWADSLRSSAFVISASLEHDLLSQWVHYAGADGFAIGLDVTKPIRETSTGYRSFNDTVVVEDWISVIYDPDEQMTFAREMLQYLIIIAKRHRPLDIDSSRLLLHHLILSLKHHAFLDEREVRYVAAAGQSQPSFRTAEGRLVPYLRVKPNPLGALPITEVVCGPTTRRPATESVVRALLDANGYESVSVRSSQIPYVGRRS